MTILEKIKENARSNPEYLMMVQSDHDKYEVLTWKQLDDYSDILAGWLDRNLKTKTPVVVYGHKHPMMIVCFIACVKTGRAYCPVDVNVPISRVESIINEVKPETILTTEPLDIGTNRIIDLGEIRDILRNENGRISRDKYIKANDVFYIIFTSGSTGIPKGVQITRDCLDHFIEWAITLGNGVGGAASHCTFINQAPFSFDLSVMDLFLCLYSGGTLWAIPKAVQNDMKQLIKSLGESNANVWVSTPSFADVCMSEPTFTSEIMPKLTDFLFCGEILTNKTVRRLQQRFPKAKIVNTYGPTESTCAVTGVTITPEMNETIIPLPVGRPKPGTWIKIIDSEGKTLPNEGERYGEIVIVGDSVSVGYWNNSERTQLSFGVMVENGKEYRYYKTGDKGCLKNGMLYYGGRIDLQVKLHGYRIELGDIENNLLKLSGIEQAVVVPKYRDGKVSSLIAGVVSSMPIYDQKETINKIKDALRESVPEYMIPKKIKFLSDMPRTNNGKIDRKAVGELL